MPNIIKDKPKKKFIRKKTPLTVPKPRPAPKSTKSSTPDYYHCLLNYANQNWHSPLTGQKQKITACCKDCKMNAPVLNHQRDKELVKLISSYKQVGESLKKLLKPLNG